MPRRLPRPALPAVALLLAVGALVGCEAALAQPEADPTGVPERWLADTAAGWPDSAGYGAVLPVLERGTDCLLAADAPELAGHPTEFTDVGWGPWQDEDDTGSYRYVCGVWAEGELSGDIQVVQTAADAELAQVVAEFTGQGSTAVQDNAVATVTSRGLEVHVLTRWYPTNPQGEYQALLADEATGAFVTLEVNSLDREAFEALRPQEVADALTDLMAAG